MNPYDILGVSKDDDQKTIKLAYHRLIKKAHPDHGGDAEEFHKIRCAYLMICEHETHSKPDELNKKADLLIYNAFSVFLNTNIGKIVEFDLDIIECTNRVFTKKMGDLTLQMQAEQQKMFQSQARIKSLTAIKPRITTGRSENMFAEAVDDKIESLQTEFKLAESRLYELGASVDVLNLAIKRLMDYKDLNTRQRLNNGFGGGFLLGGRLDTL